jgi:hypothetical protein
MRSRAWMDGARILSGFATGEVKVRGRVAARNAPAPPHCFLGIVAAVDPPAASFNRHRVRTCESLAAPRCKTTLNFAKVSALANGEPAGQAQKVFG